MPSLRMRLIGFVMAAAKRGNPLALWLQRREVRKAMADYPQQSFIVDGDYMTPDLSRPFPEDEQGGMAGDYELMPLERGAFVPDDLIGRRVEDAATMLGTYGMGGYGFVGLCLGEDWLIVPIHGAAEWMHLDGRIIQNSFADMDRGEAPWIGFDNGDDRAFLNRLTGARIVKARIGQHDMALELDNGARLEILPDAARRPRLRGDGAPRAFLETDDLRKAVFLSPSPEIWV